MAATSADFGLIGLAVMGENLALNVESRGYKVAVFNRTTEKVDAFINGRAKGKNFIGCHSIEELVKKVKKPRKIVMMVHNGIEYGDMPLICEAYLMLKEGGGLSNDELYNVFDDWNRGELQSYLIEITRDIFSVKDDQGGDGYLVDKILDVAGAKGTGKWMSQLALDLGVPSTMVTEAGYARGLSAMKEARVR